MREKYRQEHPNYKRKTTNAMKYPELVEQIILKIMDEDREVKDIEPDLARY